MKPLTYKGYSAIVEFDSEDEIFVGRIAGLNDVIGFHGESVAELKTAFAEALDDYLETCAAIGKTPEKAYSGNVMIRVRPELHSAMVRAAEIAGKSLNQWGEEVMEKAVRA
jgi:predicted HicB family RNase H-like nuclease